MYVQMYVCVCMYECIIYMYAYIYVYVSKTHNLCVFMPT